MTSGSDPGNQRSEPRRRTLKEGTIVFDGGQRTLPCRILDISESGARLNVPNVIFMPEEFQLRVRYGGIKDCEVVWQRGQTVGVRFAS